MSAGLKLVIPVANDAIPSDLGIALPVNRVALALSSLSGRGFVGVVIAPLDDAASAALPTLRKIAHSHKLQFGVALPPCRTTVEVLDPIGPIDFLWVRCQNDFHYADARLEEALLSVDVGVTLVDMDVGPEHLVVMRELDESLPSRILLRVQCDGRILSTLDRELLQETSSRCVAGGIAICESGVEPSRTLEVEDLGLRFLATGRALPRVHDLVCQDCQFEADCAGHHQMPEPEAVTKLDPHPHPRSNSWNYEVVMRVAARVDQPPPRETWGSLSQEHDLLFWWQGAFHLARTDTGDFSDAELNHIVVDLGQVYLDISQKAMLDDFPNDLRLLVRKSDVYPGVPLWLPLDEDCFLRDEAANVAPVFDLVRGDVLDVGCGGIRYAHRIEGAIAEGTLRYTAIEPFPSEETHTFVAGKGTLHETTIEEFEMPHEGYDWVLLMRSYNHLHSLRRAFSVIWSGLRPGGRVLITENVPFGLIRPAKTIEALGATPLLPFEHYRNHDSSTARRWILPHGFAVERKHEVSPGTSNEWMLVLRKTG